MRTEGAAPGRLGRQRDRWPAAEGQGQARWRRRREPFVCAAQRQEEGPRLSAAHGRALYKQQMYKTKSLRPPAPADNHTPAPPRPALVRARRSKHLVGPAREVLVLRQLLSGPLPEGHDEQRVPERRQQPVLQRAAPEPRAT